MFKNKKNFNLYHGRSKVQCCSTLAQLGQVVDQPLEYIGSGQVTVVVHVDVDNTLGVVADTGQCLEYKLYRKPSRRTYLQENPLSY